MGGVSSGILVGERRAERAVGRSTRRRSRGGLSLVGSGIGLGIAAKGKGLS